MGARARQKGCRTINPSPTAAVIPHVEHLALEDLVLAPLAEPAWARIAKALPAENGQTRVSYYKKALEKLETAEKNIRAIQKLARKGLHCNDGLFGRNGMRRDFKYKIRMDKVEKSLHASHLAPFVALVKSAGLSHFVRIARPNTAQEWSDDQVEETGRLYYQAFIDSADSLLDILTVAGRRLQLRLQEENPGTDPNLLFDAWQKDAEPGRALLWDRRQGEAANNRPTPVQQRFEAVTALFAETLLQTPDNFVKAAKASADPKLARLRLRSLFKNRDAATLSGLLQGMLAQQDGDMEPIVHLAGGYLAELGQDFSLALNEYQQVLEIDSSLVQEDALQRIASLSLQLQDHPNAFLALECLTAFSPMYLPQYAHLAGLMGQTRTALDAYAGYLELFPDDPVALARVGKLYHQAGENAFAATIFRHLLQIDPDNKVASSFLKELGLPTEPVSA
jgi:tetratricopeptide (TPR) repeat protein